MVIRRVVVVAVVNKIATHTNSLDGFTSSQVY